MKNLDLENVEEVQEYKKLIPGAYVARITTVEDVEDKEYLKIEYDITEGEFKGYFVELYAAKNFWGGKLIKSYKEKALSFFKAFITSVENSNKGYVWDNDETKLVKKLVGLVLGEEEYQKNDGSIGTRLYVNMIRSVEEIRKGGIGVPALKKLKNSPSSNNGFIEIDDSSDIPF